jgi:hypothetical protein
MKYLPLAAAFLLCASLPLHAECKDELKAMMQTHLNAGPYHVTMDQTSDQGSHKIEADVILPSSFHMVMPQMETVMVKEGTWMKANGKWMQLPGAAASKMTDTISNAIKGGMDSGLDSVKNLQCLGPQPIEGQTLTAYSFDSSGAAMGLNVTSHIMAYKDAQGRPSIMIIDGEFMGHKSKTVQHITYDPNIKITPPK